MKVFGKCILGGEHSVVRGRPALVLPLRSRALELCWQRSEGDGWTLEGADSFCAAFGAALDQALSSLGRTLPPGHWRFSLTSNIPPRAGLGSSAALSVAITRFLASVGLVPEDAFAFALSLENIFHGRSSGLDVAAVMANGPILFQKGSAPLPLASEWRPRLFLSDSGERSSTKACVEKVQGLESGLVARTDDRMHQAVSEMELAFIHQDLGQLASAMEEAGACFADWDLVTPAMAAKMQALREQGALAVKPTGSGDGGFLLSLWDREPDLIPVWGDSSAGRAE